MSLKENNPIREIPIIGKRQEKLIVGILAALLIIAVTLLLLDTRQIVEAAIGSH